MKSPSISDVNSTLNYSEVVMIELRDKFALEAMKLILKSWHDDQIYIDVKRTAEIAGLSYDMADAMMEARKL